MSFETEFWFVNIDFVFYQKIVVFYYIVLSDEVCKIG